MVKVFKTARLVIQLISEDDLEEVRLLHNDSSTLNWLSDTSIVSQEEQIKWFRNLMNNSKSRRYVARTIANSAIVGVFRLDYIDFGNKLYSDYIIFNDEKDLLIYVLLPINIIIMINIRYLHHMQFENRDEI
jgi:RimJ/RimL family protein N-acetyltransferase